MTFSYSDYLLEDVVLYSAVQALHSCGIVFIRDVPAIAESVKAVATRIGPLRATFYGSETWDVKSMPSAKNGKFFWKTQTPCVFATSQLGNGLYIDFTDYLLVAYTAQDLGFHMDLLYMADPPGIQLLHCLKATSRGGESMFADTVRAFERLQDQDQKAARTFMLGKTTYRYKNDGQWYQRTRPHLEGGFEDKEHAYERAENLEYPTHFDAINWSPPFQGPDETIGSVVTDPEIGKRQTSYLKAAAAFKNLLEEEESIFETKLDAGVCVIFNNRRIVHARKGFDPQEERHLRGAYVDMDALRSRYRVLNDKYGAVKLPDAVERQE